MGDQLSYQLDPRAPASDAHLNPILADIDVRLKGLEAEALSLGAIEQQAVGLMLERINQVLAPAYTAIADKAHLGAILTAPATGAVMLPAAGLLTFAVPTGSRAAFAPSLFLGLVATSDPTAKIAASLVSYDADTGALVVDVVSSAGPAGQIFSTWTVTISPVIQTLLADEDGSVVWNNADSPRWSLRRTPTAESGSNAGSDLELLRCLDAGTVIDAILTASRATGKVTFTYIPVVGTAAPGTSNDDAASTAFVMDAVGGIGGGSYLPIAGGTISGDLKIDRNNPSGNPTFTTDSPAATYQGWIARRNGTIRWAWYLGYADAESGSNAGTSARLLAYGDTGTFIGTALAIKRSTLDMGIGHITPLRRLHPLVDDAVNNAVTQVLRLTHTTSGTPANGIGVGIEFEAEAGGGNKVGATLESVATDVTPASEDFDLVLKTMMAGAAASEALRIGPQVKVSRPFYFPATALVDAATIAWDAGVIQCPTVTLGGNRTFGAPTNLKDGCAYMLRVVQDGTGSRTLTWNAVFKFGSTPVLQTAAGAVDVFLFESDGTNLIGKHLNEVVSGSPFSAGYGPSSDQTITTAGLLTIAHGLGVAPTLVQLRLKCTTADLGYSVGDIVEFANGVSPGNDRMLAVTSDATNIYVRFGASVIGLPNKTSGVFASITAASWKLTVRAWK